ncbi:MAG: hypothetical protein ABIS03_03085 [Gemmatimonadaceae bacterium]
MTTIAPEGTPTIDSILDLLDLHHQRATYGAVAAVVNSSPRSLMMGRERNQRSSWIVSRSSGVATGYSDDQNHLSLTERADVLDTPERLKAWLADPA